MPAPTSRPEASHFCTLPGLYPLSTFSKSYPGVPVSQTLNRSQIAENIGLGAPVAPHATNMEYIREAAQLGGASTFVEKFPDQYGTYLERPVKDYYSGLPEGTTRCVWCDYSTFGPIHDAILVCLVESWTTALSSMQWKVDQGAQAEVFPAGKHNEWLCRIFYNSSEVDEI